MDWLPISITVALLSCGALAVLAGLWRPGAARAVALAGTASALAASVYGLARALRVGPLRHDLGGWAPPVGIEYVLDPLAGFVLTLVTFIGLVVVVYPARAGFGGEPARGVPLYALVLLLLAGLAGVVSSRDLFNLFVFLEIYAIASYALVALGGARAVFASFRYLIIGSVGSGLYLLGVGFLYFLTGSLHMDDVAARLPAAGDSPTVVAAIVLIVVGLGIKAALFPLHVWLPDAHASAPPSVAALLAAVQVKVGAYALVRILFTVFDLDAVAAELPLLELLAWFGAAGVVFGSVQAIRQQDFKRLLAYSTVAQLGFIGLGIGLATPLALAGALLHVVNHAFMKGCLFLVAGGVYAGTGVRHIRRFTGLGRRMPLTMAAFALAAMAMIGIPPTAGFFSKWYLLLASLDAGRWAFAVVIVASSLLTLAYFLRVFERVWLGADVDEAVASASEPPAGVVAPVGVLAAGVLVLGLGNAWIVTGILEQVSIDLLGTGIGWP